MPSAVVNESGWGIHAARFVTSGVESVALFGRDGSRWGGASLAGIAPMYGVRTINQFATLMADLAAGRISMQGLVFDGVKYMATNYVTNATMYGKKGTPCCAFGLTKKMAIVMLADTSRGGTPANLAIQLDSARSYFASIGF